MIALPLPVVALAFSITAIVCLIDMHLTTLKPRKFFRAFQFVAFALAAMVYWRAYAEGEPIPQPEIRIVLILISVLAISEIVSRWDIWFRGRTHKHG
jgi:hypothetical protein